MMDGYAVIAEDTFAAGRYDPAALRRVERVFTGQVPSRRVGRGECIEIATGAPMPDGADAVVMVEETESDGDQVRVFAPVHPRQHVARRGGDIATGQVAVGRGQALTPSRIGALAALGVADVDVYARPRVALLSTGSEIVEPGRPLAPGHIYDINRYTLAAVVRQHGGDPAPLPAVADDLAALEEALDRALAADLVVFSGGSSAGERDLMLDLLSRRGEVLFHGIAVKPGKPTLSGRVGRTPVLGMPGNPTSCLSNAYLLLVPALRRMARLPEHRFRTVRAPLGQRIASTTGRVQFYTVRLVDGVAAPAFKGSGDITSMSQADGFIVIPAQTEVVEKGALVEVQLFS
jgi:molybdenum cofactor synthesis domain-containing protein